MTTQRLAEAEARIPDPRVALARELDRALALLARRRVDDKVAHDLRRSIKRARSLLGLLRDVVGEKAYARENRALRDAARNLAPMRDAKVVRETLAALGARASAPAPGTPAPVAPLLQAVRGVRERTARWRMPRTKWPAVADGIRRIYRHARKALRAVDERPTDRNLHESRKDVKRLGIAVGFLAPTGAKRLKKVVKRADAVADDLGDDHDLALVAHRLPGGRLSAPVRRELAKRRRKLQERALRHARSLLRARPETFVRRLSRAPLKR
jgi:CHAD domain-containing protein